MPYFYILVTTIYTFYPNAAAIDIENAFVAALAEVISVPVSFGKVIVLSAVGSVTVSVVSWASAVAPSNTILESVNVKFVAVSVVIVGELIVGFVKVLLVSHGKNNRTFNNVLDSSGTKHHGHFWKSTNLGRK